MKIDYKRSLFRAGTGWHKAPPSIRGDEMDTSH